MFSVHIGGQVVSLFGIKTAKKDSLESVSMSHVNSMLGCCELRKSCHFSGVDPLEPVGSKNLEQHENLPNDKNILIILIRVTFLLPSPPKSPPKGFKRR